MSELWNQQIGLAQTRRLCVLSQYRSTVLMLAIPSSLDNPKGIIDNPANVTQYR